MPSTLETFGQPANSFEKQTWDTLKNTLGYLEGNYIILGDVRIGHRQIDCLVIAPQCVFTVECKGVEGKVVKNYNGGVKIFDFNSGKEILGNRHENPFKQADNQWKTTRRFLNDAGANIFVQALIVFPDKCLFDLPTKENQGPVFTTLANLPWHIKNIQPKLKTELTRKQQESIYYLIKYGPEKIYEGVKKSLATIRPLPQSKTNNSSIPIKTLPVNKPASRPKPQPSTRPTKTSSPPPKQRRDNNSFLHQIGRVISNLFKWIISLPFKPRTYIFLLFACPLSLCATWSWSTSQLSPTGLPPAASFSNLEESENTSETPIPTLSTAEGDASPKPLVTIERVETNPTETINTPIPTERIQTLRVLLGSNIRSGPSIEHSILMTTDNTIVVQVLDQTPDGYWFFVQHPDTEIMGWIGSTRVEQYSDP